MIEVLEFAFSGFWTWLGCWMALCVICTCASYVRLVVVSITKVTQHVAGPRVDVKDRK